MLLCAISQSVYFAACYTGRLERMLAGIKLNPQCANYYRKTATLYTFLAWILLVLNYAFLFYSIFFTGYLMDIMLAPITTYVNMSVLWIPRLLVFFFDLYFCAAWVFPQVMSLMLATIFSHQYRQLEQALEQRLIDTNQSPISDLDVETLRQHHEHITSSVDEADSFLKLSNAAAFCCQLFGTILLLYTLIFFTLR